MNDIFPAIQRRFNMDPECTLRCRILYQVGEDERAPKPYARWAETGGASLDGFDVDATQHDGEFVLHSEGVTADAVRLMADSITRAFDDKTLFQGGFSQIDSHRTGPPIIEHDEGVYTATIPYTVYAVLAAQTPEVVG